MPKRKPTKWNYPAFDGMSRTKFDMHYHEKNEKGETVPKLLTKEVGGKIKPMTLDEGWEHIQARLVEMKNEKAEAEKEAAKAEKGAEKASEKK